MVYYGALSKGCERCRRRKIKCDQRKPDCARCEKSRVHCPGYRDLTPIQFRDESQRVIRKNGGKRGNLPQPLAPSACLSSSFARLRSFTTSELAAAFFFTRYAYDDPRMENKFQDWLCRSYMEEEPTQPLRSAIEAVGLAGISNIHGRSSIGLESKVRYCQALKALNQALEDPEQAIADSTFAAIMFLGFFETMTFDSWDRYQRWVAHVDGAGAVLELRGLEQLGSERGTLLYMMIRTQIIQACIHQGLPVPLPLLRITCHFANGEIRRKWQENHVASHASMCEISFRIVNLRAAISNGDLKHIGVIRETVIEIDRDLEDWRAGVPEEWMPILERGLRSPYCERFQDQRPFYPSLWVAEAWNNWRMLRILINEIGLTNEQHAQSPDYTRMSIAVNAIQTLSSDICASVSHFDGTSRILTLIQPLRLVCEDENNRRTVRNFAIEQLRHIEELMGVRQAGLFAKTAANQMNLELEEEASNGSSEGCTSLY